MHAAHEPRYRGDSMRETLARLRARYKPELTGALGLRERFKLGAVAYLLPFCVLALLFIWTMWLGREYLVFSKSAVPAGREFLSTIQAHHLWTRVQDCGWCALWDGSERGGFPALADPLAGSLFPLNAASTLIWGAVNGAKVALLAALFLAGVAQIWLARELKLGWLAGVWIALMAIAGGELAGRMELGLFSLLTSLSMAAFVFPAAIRVSRRGDHRSTALLGLVLALFVLSGQGYVQVGMALISPAFVILIWRAPAGEKIVLRRFVEAVGLALLLASPFLVPFLHFMPNFAKDSDPGFGAAQPLGYYVLNLVVGDYTYLTSPILDKLPYPHMYAMFIGWVPVILALACLRLAKREDYRVIFFLATSAILALIVGSGELLKWAASWLPELGALRYIPVVGGLAVPPILGLAGYALEHIWRLDWPSLAFHWSNRKISDGRVLDLRWLLLIPLLLALKTAYTFSHQWLYTDILSPGVYDVLTALKTPDAQWVEPPFGEHVYIEPAVRQGLKLSPGWMTWHWKDRQMPQPVLEASFGDPPADSSGVVAKVRDVTIFARNSPAYAAVYGSTDSSPCKAQTEGGNITVSCQSSLSGVLQVEENSYSGWKAWRDGQPVALRDSDWLSVDAPAGNHTYMFRYQPWDVPLGLLSCLVGLVICGAMVVAPTEDSRIEKNPRSH